MKKVKHLALYQEPFIKVVSFTIERGFEDSFSGGGQSPVEDPDDPDAPQQGSSSGFLSVNSGKNEIFSFSHSF